MAGKPGTRLGIGLVLFISLTLILAAPAVARAKKTLTFKESYMVWDERYWPTKPVSGGTFRQAVPEYIGLMNPNHWPVNDWETITYIYEKPVYTDGTYRPCFPFMAESWKYLDDKTAVITFRQGITFHDGTPFNAEAFKYQIEWIQDRGNGCFSRGWLRPIKSMEVVDPYTLKFHFRSPWPGFIGMIAYVPGYAMSAEALRQGGPKALETKPVGTGPYMLQEASPGNYLILKRNPNWWFGREIGQPAMPYFDAVRINVIPDPTIQLANLRAGKIDFLALDKSQYTLVKGDPNLRVHIYPRNMTEALNCNLAKGACQDIRVRQAISHAIDRKALIAGTQFGLARIAAGVYPDVHWCHNPGLKPVAFDPERSKRLLAEAGYEKGLKLVGYVRSTPSSLAVAEAIKAMLDHVGIDWQVTGLDSAAFGDKMKNQEYDLAAGAAAWIFDPDTVAYGRYHPNGAFNYGRNFGQKVVDLVEAGRAEVDDNKRTAIYQELDRVLYDMCADVWLWYGSEVEVLRRVVQGRNIDFYLQGREAYGLSHSMWFKDGKP